MIDAGKGLTVLRTDELKKLLLLLHQGHLEGPVSPEGLTIVGFQYRTGLLMGALRGLSTAGIRAVLVCVLAERMN
jgi:hypothetical protein